MDKARFKSSDLSSRSAKENHERVPAAVAPTPHPQQVASPPKSSSPELAVSAVRFATAAPANAADSALAPVNKPRVFRSKRFGSLAFRAASSASFRCLSSSRRRSSSTIAFNFSGTRLCSSASNSAFKASFGFSSRWVRRKSVVAGAVSLTSPASPALRSSRFLLPKAWDSRSLTCGRFSYWLKAVRARVRKVDFALKETRNRKGSSRSSWSCPKPSMASRRLFSSPPCNDSKAFKTSASGAQAPDGGQGSVWVCRTNSHLKSKVKAAFSSTLLSVFCAVSAAMRSTSGCLAKEPSDFKVARVIALLDPASRRW